METQTYLIPHKYHSSELNHLYEALAKAQSEIKPVRSNKRNTFFKSDYADLLAVVDGSREILSKHGLSVLQLIQTFDNGTYMLCRLGHI
ncbi:ERF family protein, partial [Anaplasma marginale]|uniref:ERF family protein n=1 Tax=Anaplasma marginale TaxID=770 RepID=UPI0018E9A382